MERFRLTMEAALRGLDKRLEAAKEPSDTFVVSEQKTRFYKAFCYLVYGHLYKDGVCLRCGKIQNKK